MPLKTILLIISFFTGCAGALYQPMIGVVTYMMLYHVWPEDQWWGKVISHWGLRYAFTAALCLGVGVLIRRHTLRLGSVRWTSLETMFVLMVVVGAISMFLGADPEDGILSPLSYKMVDKLAKVILFILLMTRVVTTVDRVQMIMWTIVIGTLYIGYQAWSAAPCRFIYSRLTGLGGPDFSESSYLGAHFAAALPIIGVQFLRGDLKAKMLSAVAGAFAINGLILTQTRAAFVGVLVGLIVAVLFAVKGKRRRVILYLLPGLMVAAYLTDAKFRTRMETIRAGTDQMDVSSSNRIRIWEAAGEMFVTRPLGVGAGKFLRNLSRYDSTLRSRDAHNTLIRCACELGMQGIILLVAIIFMSFVMLWRARHIARGTSADLLIRYQCYAFGTSLVVMLTCGMFMSQLYIEEFWWFLAFPICLFRAAGNARLESAPALEGSLDGSDEMADESSVQWRRLPWEHPEPVGGV